MEKYVKPTLEEIEILDRVVFCEGSEMGKVTHEDCVRDPDLPGCEYLNTTNGGGAKSKMALSGFYHAIKENIEEGFVEPEQDILNEASELNEQTEEVVPESEETSGVQEILEGLFTPSETNEEFFNESPIVEEEPIVEEIPQEDINEGGF